MRINVVLSFISRIILIVSITLLIPLLWSLYLNDGMWLVFVKTILVFVFCGLFLYYLFPLKMEKIKPVEGYLIVTCVWLVTVILGMFPFLFSGVMSFTDAFFETMSGFTTTGATILTDIEALPPSILMWRSLTQWLGGMGIIVLFVALILQFGSGAKKMFSAEAPGMVVEKLTPRLSDTAKSLWLIYLFFSLLALLFLYLAGMTFYDSMAHAFTSIATGGFSPKNDSIGYYMDNTAIQVVLILFMFLGGTNFALFYLFYKKKTWSVFWKSEEFRLYLKIFLAAALLVFISLYLSGIEDQGFLPVTALFQVVSILTTTGYVTVDFDAWPNLARNVMFILFFIGGSVGSTAGGMKLIRFVILFKAAKSELFRLRHPRMIRRVKVNRVNIDDNLVINTLVFFFLYFLLIGLGTVVMSSMDLDLESALSSVLASLGIIGPAFGVVGPAESYANIPVFGKYFLSGLMLLGRLEIFTILILFFRSVRE